MVFEVFPARSEIVGTTLQCEFDTHGAAAKILRPLFSGCCAEMAANVLLAKFGEMEIILQATFAHMVPLYEYIACYTRARAWGQYRGRPIEIRIVLAKAARMRSLHRTVARFHRMTA